MKVRAKVVPARCRRSKLPYGMRVEEKNGDWVITWGFKLEESDLKSEGYIGESLNGSFHNDEDFEGCPYCGNNSFVVCGKCKKVTCFGATDTEFICAWCGNRGKVTIVDKLDLSGGNY
ncbi:MAG: hypothetical protein K5694_00020 [Bacilli bacterium]|nr:hypothetical protein [Bacilli bacterium]